MRLILILLVLRSKTNNIKIVKSGSKKTKFFFRIQITRILIYLSALRLNILKLSANAMISERNHKYCD